MRVIVSKVGGVRLAHVTHKGDSGRYIDNTCFFSGNPSPDIIVDVIITKKDAKRILKGFKKSNKL